jgi:hypothetical protein
MIIIDVIFERILLLVKEKSMVLGCFRSGAILEYY